MQTTNKQKKTTFFPEVLSGKETFGKYAIFFFHRYCTSGCYKMEKTLEIEYSCKFLNC